jgi:hypothetical protein
MIGQGTVPRWLPRLLRRIHELAGQGRVRLTLKAARELAALGAGLDVQDGCDVLAALPRTTSRSGSSPSTHASGCTYSSRRSPGRLSTSSWS